MGDPEVKILRSKTRKRNYIAKKMLETKTMVKKIHMSAKDRERQRKWRVEKDPEGDYDQVDDWLTHTENF